MSNVTTPGGSQQIAAHHKQMLSQDWKIADSIIEAREFRTLSGSKEITVLGFKSGTGPGLLVPLRSATGVNGKYAYRLDNPKRLGKNSRNEGWLARYTVPAGQSPMIDCPSASVAKLKDPQVDLWMTTGPIQADAIASQGACAIAIVGLWTMGGIVSHEELRRLPDWETISLNGRRVWFVDEPPEQADRQVAAATNTLIDTLVSKGCDVRRIRIPLHAYAAEYGLLEWLGGGNSLDALHAFNQAAAVQPGQLGESDRPAEFILADDDGPELRRPLGLVDGKGYVAGRRKVRIVQEAPAASDTSDGGDKQADAEEESRLIVVRDDGEIFGGQRPLSQLGFNVLLRGDIPNDRRWSKKGLESYRRGERPDPIQVFTRLRAVINYFIDFHNSLADQQTMCEFVACYVLSTWFLDAFDVIGYIWINGERGSGKTNLLILISELSHLGLLVTHSSSFASLREMAENGATLACDDAETITDPKTDPDKKALLLAGNRRGVHAALQEQGPDKNWHIRYVPVYCSRSFSAIRLPDPTLASRMIILPLQRTANRSKGNIDPMDYEVWPHDRRQLRDSLWGLGLGNLAKMPTYSAWVGANARLQSRNLQPWRAVLAVAKWLDDQGVHGLYERMEALSLAYQKERPELELADTTRVVIQALCDCAIRATNASSASRPVKTVIVPVDEVGKAARSLVEDEELDIELKWISNAKIGKILQRLRFHQVPRPGGKGSRPRAVGLEDLASLAASYNVDFAGRTLESGLTIAEYLKLDGTTGTFGTSGTKATPSTGTTTTAARGLPGINPAACYACGGTEYWQRADGQMVCSRCHPRPTDLR